MKTLHTMVSTLLIILDEIGVSSGASSRERDFLTNFGMRSESSKREEISSDIPTRERDFLENFGKMSGPRNDRESTPKLKCSPATIESSSIGHQSPPVERPVRERSRSPHARYEVSHARSMLAPTRLPSFSGFGCGLEELSFIRLIPRVDQNQIFQLRRYTFPMEKPLEMQMQKNVYKSMPVKEQIVVCTSDGDVFAFLETHDVLAGMYTHNIDRNKRRAKINMVTGTVTLLTKEEVTVVPVGVRRTIAGCFIVQNTRINPSERAFRGVKR